MTDETKPEVELADGNAISILCQCRRAAQKAGWNQERIKGMQDEMLGGDYDQVVATADKYFEVV